MGDRKTALFVIISDTDDTFNFVVSILYTQLFNLLCDKADDVYGGRLPVHVRCLLDEFANIGQIPKFEKLIATIRSREISASIILQSQSQLKAIYKDNADTIVGNCDTTLCLHPPGRTQPQRQYPCAYRYQFSADSRSSILALYGQTGRHPRRVQTPLHRRGDGILQSRSHGAVPPGKSLSNRPFAWQQKPHYRA